LFSPCHLFCSNGIHQAFLDYAHILTRLPELQASLDDTDAIPDASQASELEDLTRSIPKLINILPEVLRNRDDPRHNAALAEMIAEFVLRLDKVKPLALVSNGLLIHMQYACLWCLNLHSQAPLKPTVMDDTTKLRHIHSTAYERFVKAIQVS